MKLYTLGRSEHEIASDEDDEDDGGGADGDSESGYAPELLIGVSVEREGKMNGAEEGPQDDEDPEKEVRVF